MRYTAEELQATAEKRRQVLLVQVLCGKTWMFLNGGILCGAWRIADFHTKDVIAAKLEEYKRVNPGREFRTISAAEAAEAELIEDAP